MIGRKESISILKKAMQFSTADQIEVKINGEDLALTRFANSRIHQNLARQNTKLEVRAVFGKKIGSATTNNLDEESIRKVVETAETLAKLQEDNKDFVSLPKPGKIVETENYYEATANYTPEMRARDVGTIASKADEKGFKVFGSHAITVNELAVMNSLGVEAYNRNTSAYLRTVIEGPNGTGYADFLDRDVSKINAEAIAAEAVERTFMAQNPRPLPTGDYEVVFLPYAVADIIRFPGYLGFDAASMQDGRSFMVGKLGQKITGDKITVYDDGLDARSLNMPFGHEGMPKQRVNIITNGVADGVVYDSYTAHKEGKESTGHSSYVWRSYTSMPGNLIMQNGNSSVEEMIKRTKKGLLVTRFHYTHCPEPRQVIMTGTTRDGIFYIEDGEVKFPVMNMRLTDSVLRIFENVDLISKDVKLQRDWWSTFTSVLPAIHTTSCKWTGSTSF